jgi:hypothetical protein
VTKTLDKKKTKSAHVALMKQTHSNRKLSFRTLSQLKILVMVKVAGGTQTYVSQWQKNPRGTDGKIS